jgi:ABC transporter substrate binding protein (PQQ-dependent alcohol dehydrogenase system)
LIEALSMTNSMAYSMTQKRWRTSVFALMALSTLLGFTQTAKAANWSVTLIEQANNPKLDRQRVERAYLGHPLGGAGEAIAMALDDAQFELEAAKTTITLKSEQVSSVEAAKAAAQKAEKAGSPLLVINLPGAWASAVASAVKLPILNIGASEDNLREGDCLANLYHVLPSERMRADALAQALMARKWSQVLLLVGPMPEDIKRSQTAQASMKRYGLKLVANKSFKLSTDPRERTLANLQLLTANPTYDAVWVVDSDGEFARSLPYNTAQARPVVGDAGMVALAWQVNFDRFGAPQVTRRFTKVAKRAMTDIDWAAWMAGKAVVAAAMATTTQSRTDAASIAKALSSVSLDGSKGVPLQFRTWDRQLRQSMLLSDGQGVLATMPMEGILHPKNILDTLGADEGEKLCKFKS